MQYPVLWNFPSFSKGVMCGNRDECEPGDLLSKILQISKNKKKQKKVFKAQMGYGGTQQCEKKNISCKNVVLESEDR